MSWIRIIAIGLIILLIIMTFIAEPKLSSQYFKALFKSGFRLIKGIGNTFSGFFNKYRVKPANNVTEEK